MKKSIARILPVLVLLAVAPAHAVASGGAPADTGPDGTAAVPSSVSGQFTHSPGLGLEVVRRMVPATTKGWARYGLRARVTCTSACYVTTTIEVTNATRRRLGLRSNLLGSRTVLITDVMERWSTVRLTPSAARALSQAPPGIRMHARTKFVATSGAGEVDRVSFR